MSTKITLDLDAYGMDHREFVEWIRGGLGGKFEKVADDIEEQLHPTPPEPKGDYLLQEPSGQVSVPVGKGVLNRQDDGARLYWDTLWHYHGSDLKIYRPTPSPNVTECGEDMSIPRHCVRRPGHTGGHNAIFTNLPGCDA